MDVHCEMLMDVHSVYLGNRMFVSNDSEIYCEYLHLF